MNHIFLSYQHESHEHAQAVRKLGEMLRAAGLPVESDQFFQDQHPGGPNENWATWSEDQAENSACALIVCSNGWFDSYRKKGTKGRGLGAALEAEVFARAIYDEKGHNARARLVILDDFKTADIPPRLSSWHIFRPLAHAADFEQMCKWARQRLAMPGNPSSLQKVVFLAECVSDMKKERKNLQAFLEDKGWQIRPSSAYEETNRNLLLETDLRASIASVQLLESYPRESGFDQQQDTLARKLGKPCFYFRDDKIAVDEAEPQHREFLARKDMILGSFEDFKRHVADELDKLWQRQKSVPSAPVGMRKALVRVVVRSPNRNSLWDKVFEWIDQEPDIRPHLLEESENLMDKDNSGVPCHGYLIVCDCNAYDDKQYSPRIDLEHCSLIQLRETNDSRVPPTGLVYCPPPAALWARLQQVAPPSLHRILGDAPNTNLNQFFEAVRRVAL